MPNTKPAVKSELHPRNKHNEGYNFTVLTEVLPELKEHVFVNKYDTETLDFSNPEAVKLLNKALLKCHYDVDYWDIPNGYLCPPVPGRADYLHYIADLIGNDSDKQIKCIDIGTGANCIYPIIGVAEYDWRFVATDIDEDALEVAFKIVNNNDILRGQIELRRQINSRFIFREVISADEYFDVSICNPPFHASEKEARMGSLRKTKNLGNKKPLLNFGGQSNELWCEGGEKAFLTNMAYESRHFTRQVGWFTSLVSKKDNIRPLKKLLKRLEAKEVKVIEMATGNKISRILAWRY